MGYTPPHVTSGARGQVGRPTPRHIRGHSKYRRRHRGTRRLMSFRVHGEGDSRNVGRPVVSRGGQFVHWLIVSVVGRFGRPTAAVSRSGSFEVLEAAYGVHATSCRFGCMERGLEAASGVKRRLGWLVTWQGTRR